MWSTLSFCKCFFLYTTGTHNKRTLFPIVRTGRWISALGRHLYWSSVVALDLHCSLSITARLPSESPAHVQTNGQFIRLQLVPNCFVALTASNNYFIGVS